MADTITITGNLAADPVRRRTGTGLEVTTFRMASTHRRFDADKKAWVDVDANWYQVSAFRGLGEHAFASLHKGERVIVTGRLRVRDWDNGTQKGTSVEVDADGIGHDLLWGTSRFERAARGSQEWSVPPGGRSDGREGTGGTASAPESTGGVDAGAAPGASDPAEPQPEAWPRAEALAEVPF